MEESVEKDSLKQLKDLSISVAEDEQPGLAPKTKSEPVVQLSTKMPCKQTGLIYDESMVNHKCLWDTLYPDSPERFSVILSRIKELGLHDRCALLEPRKATEDELLLVHSKEHFDAMKSSSGVVDIEQLQQLSSKYDCVFFHPETFDLSLLAAGSVLKLVEEVVSGNVKNGFALVRPPGHHAMKEEACGFCYFNNVAVAASYAVNELLLDKVLVVDFDVHHGQGTQYAFYDDSRVLYFSSHRYDEGIFWPELLESNYNYAGSVNAKGFNVNVPLNEEGLHNGDFLAIWMNVLLPIAYEFNPDLVIISAGYDAAIGCPEGEMLITPAMYAHLCHTLMGLANGKVVAVLEGGYCLSSLAESAALTLRALIGDPCPRLDLIPYPLHKAMVNTILDVLWAQKPFWHMFCVQDEFDRRANGIEEKEKCRRRRHLPVVEYKGKTLVTPKPQSYQVKDIHRPQDPAVRQQCETLLAQLKASTNLAVPRHRTAVVYHKEMTLHSPDYHNWLNPETPRRVQSIYLTLEAAGLLRRCHLIQQKRYATEEELALVHDQNYVSFIKSTVNMSDEELKNAMGRYSDIYITPHTYEGARLAAGSLLQVVDGVLAGDYQNAFAIIRPPGHHANKSKAAGFCIFNNVALAAKYALNKEGVNRVLIVDWDVHHGDGTQALVKDDDRIAFVSLHRYDHCTFYPNTPDSNVNIRRNVVNIPWNGGPMSDYDYLLAFFNIVLPVAYEFDPDLVMVSCGFDAAESDPLGHYKLSPEVYGHMTHLLSSLANGKLVVALEGGYCLDAISKCAAKVVESLLGDSPRVLPELRLNISSKDTIRKAMAYHETYWSCLAFNADLPDDQVQF